MHFHFQKEMKIEVLSPSSRAQAIVHWTIAFKFSNPSLYFAIKEIPIRLDGDFFYGGAGGI